MGTKNNPGRFDCYDAADPDEPMFVLLARDPLAPMLVERWARIRRDEMDEDPAKVAEAFDCAAAMRQWRDAQYVELTGDDLPYHLRADAAPLARCNRCGRETWSVEEVGVEDRLSQPDGGPCGGLMLPTGK